MVREYVGARYVPIYDGDWDPTKVYEPLTIVTVANVGSYTSKKYVPAGIPITNTEYWALSGATTGQIIQLQEDVQDLQEDVEDLTIKTTRKYILIGDSYFNRTNSAGDNVPRIFRDALGLVDNDSLYVTRIAGASFAASDPDLRFITLITALTPSVTNANEITDVIVIGGANDASNTAANTISAIITFNDYVKLNYPNAHVTLMPCGLTFTQAGMALNHNNLYPAWCTQDGIGVPYIANSEYILRDTRLLDGTDLCHPAADGVQAIGDALINWAMTGSIDVFHRLGLAYGYMQAVPLSHSEAATVTAGSYTAYRHNGAFSLAGTDATAGVRLVTANNLNIPVSGGYAIKFPDTLFTGTARNDTYTSHAIDALHGKLYPCVLQPKAVVGSMGVWAYFPTGIPSSDAVKDLFIGIDFSGVD